MKNQAGREKKKTTKQAKKKQKQKYIQVQQREK